MPEEVVPLVEGNMLQVFPQILAVMDFLLQVLERRY